MGTGSPSNKLGTSTVTGRTISRSCWLIKPRVTHTHTACIRRYFGIYFNVPRHYTTHFSSAHE